MKIHPISKDKRWTITKEFIGEQAAKFVIRFCDEMIGHRATYPAAVTVAVCAKARRDMDLTIPAEMLNEVKSQKSKGSSLELVAIFAESGQITKEQEETLQDIVDSIYHPKDN